MKMFPIFYNMRYLGVFSLKAPGPIYQHSINQYANGTFFFNEETRMHELFEFAEKSDLFSASMLQVDLSEIQAVDTYKENYPFTVRFKKYKIKYNKKYL